MSTMSAAQRIKVRRPVVAGNHTLAIDQKRLCFETLRGFDNGWEAGSSIEVRKLLQKLRKCNTA